MGLTLKYMTPIIREHSAPALLTLLDVPWQPLTLDWEQTLWFLWCCVRFIIGLHRP